MVGSRRGARGSRIDERRHGWPQPTENDRATGDGVASGHIRRLAGQGQGKDNARVTRHTQCQGQKEDSRTRDRLLRAEITKTNKLAICYRCFSHQVSRARAAVPQVLPQRPHIPACPSPIPRLTGARAVTAPHCIIQNTLYADCSCIVWWFSVIDSGGGKARSVC